MNDLEKRVLRLIPTGASQPRQAKYIAQLVGVDIRTVRNIVNRLIIRYSVPIVVKRGLVSGFYIPETDSERLGGIRELRAQHKNEGKRLDTLISASLTDWKEYLKDDEPTEP